MNEHIERPIEAVGGDDLGDVLVDLLQRPDPSPGHGGVVSVQQLSLEG